MRSWWRIQWPWLSSPCIVTEIVPSQPSCSLSIKLWNCAEPLYLLAAVTTWIRNSIESNHAWKTKTDPRYHDFHPRVKFESYTYGFESTTTERLQMYISHFIVTFDNKTFSFLVSNDKIPSCEANTSRSQFSGANKRHWESGAGGCLHFTAALLQPFSTMMCLCSPDSGSLIT